MTEARIALLPDRGVVSVTGEDAKSFLDNLITNDMDLLEKQAAIHAGLLTPQGKILFAFFVIRTPAGFLLEASLGETAALAKRLSMYKLRAKVEIKDAAGEVIVAVSQGAVRARPQGVIAFEDPRHLALGDRVLIPGPTVGDALARMGAQRMLLNVYAAERIRVGVPEPGQDYAVGDTFPHEANFDRYNGVSFTKGCYVGQEVVARMQNKTVVRKRVVRIEGDGALQSGADIKVGAAVIGSIGTAVQNFGLAMLRLDRVSEAIDKQQPITVGDVSISVDGAAMTAYRDSVRERAAVAP